MSRGGLATHTEVVSLPSQVVCTRSEMTRHVPVSWPGVVSAMSDYCEPHHKLTNAVLVFPALVNNTELTAQGCCFARQFVSR
jgi:hypothetical protein